MIHFHYPYGATPLDPDEIEGLIPAHISTYAQLNEWEQENILATENWHSQRQFSYSEILDSTFIKKTHHRMFNETWKWAGTFRSTEKSIGIDPLHIPVRLKTLLDDVIYQIEQETYYIEEIAARFHHRLVAIHPFPNGNGRHARFVTDQLLISRGQSRFLWGSQLKREISDEEIRKKYIEALRAADKHNYAQLLEFVK